MFFLSCAAPQKLKLPVRSASKGLKHLCKFASKQNICSQHEAPALFALAGECIYTPHTPASQLPLQLAKLAENSRPRGKTKARDVLSLSTRETDCERGFQQRGKEDLGKRALMAPPKCSTSHLCKQSPFFHPN